MLAPPPVEMNVMYPDRQNLFTAATESEYKTIFNDLDTAFGYIVGKEGFIFYAE